MTTNKLTRLFCDTDTITLEREDRIFSITRNKDGTFYVEERCDRYFGSVYTKNEMIDLLKELKEFVNG